ncbi:MAG: M43 family zinc metalloprotease [Bacteroidia bacterium]|nr:M43 family zinc metalloprotease [Bacteroidia bacterium]
MLATFLSWISWLQIEWCGTKASKAQVGSLREALLSASQQWVQAKSQIEGECTPSRYIIPVVFHVIYSGTSDYVPYERIWQEVLQVYEDFRKMPETSSYTAGGADMEVEFSLATKDPNGNPTTGVVYWLYNQPPLNWSSPNFCADTQELPMKQATGWDPQRYLNIWVVPTICFTGENGECSICGVIGGFAAYPLYEAPEVYGVVIGARSFQRPWTDRVLTHELGHCLDLIHPFEEGCGTTDCLNSGDAVCDTPPTLFANFEVLRANTCNNDSPDQPDNPRNHMDYVIGREANHFTYGQRERSWAAIESPISLLNPLIQPTIPAQTGTGPYGYVKAYFTASQRVGCVGEPIQFFSYSLGMPHIHEWDFGGGVAEDASSACPRVSFSEPGSYSIRLIVENLSGRRDTLVKSDYILIEDAKRTLPYVEGFEEPTFPPSGSYIENPDGRRTWDKISSASPPRGAYGRSQSSMRMPFYINSVYHEKDSWISPVLDLSTYRREENSVILRFSWAYACLDYEKSDTSDPSYRLDYTDTLKIYISSDCGRSWRLLWAKGGRDLSTHPAGCIQARGTYLGYLYTPSASEWRTDSLLLDEFIGERIRIKLESISGWGNNLYVDEIQVDTVAPRPSHLHSFFSMPAQVYFHGGIMYLQAAESLSAIEVTFYDVSGKCLYRHTFSSLSSGLHAFPLPLDKLAAGVYQVYVRHERGCQSLKYAHLP